MQKIILLDFDGVIHSYKSGWKGEDIIPDPPVVGVFDSIIEYLNHGFDVQVYSSRSKSDVGIQAMKTWFSTHNFPADSLHLLKFPVQKPPAWITIDDRCIQFDGVLPSIDDIDEFQPWYKR